MVMAGPRDAAGRALYAPWPWDPGISAPGWRAWMLGDASSDARHASAEAAALGALYATPPDAKLTLGNFDFERDPQRLRAMHQLHDTADDVQLAGFRARGGKLVLLHGAADPVYSAWDTVDYQRRANVAHGADAAAQFVRTFVVPGMNHCAGGPATDRFDALAAIVEWVEQGRPPQRIEARGSAVLHDETRPLCPWPQVARYSGRGAVNDSA
jgi:feruloyl esterase